MAHPLRVGEQVDRVAEHLLEGLPGPDRRSDCSPRWLLVEVVAH
ncbi:hypothetical protein [Modestobacter lacusdianchii]